MSSTAMPGFGSPGTVSISMTSKCYADVIIPQGGNDRVVVDLLLPLIRSLV